MRVPVVMQQGCWSMDPGSSPSWGLKWHAVLGAQVSRVDPASRKGYASREAGCNNNGTLESADRRGNLPIPLPRSSTHQTKVKHGDLVSFLWWWVIPLRGPCRMPETMQDHQGQHGCSSQRGNRGDVHNACPATHPPTHPHKIAKHSTTGAVECESSSVGVKQKACSTPIGAFL